ncbi:MAG: hypothetical protein WCT23_03225 [Candidatus Neomarinimicrobiota bacterium]
MKKLLFLFILLTVSLAAYEFAADSWGNYTAFDPDKRSMGMTYPQSWVTPSEFLLKPIYEDSSKFLGKWEHVITLNKDNGSYDLSSNIVAQYLPHSSPQRWSVGLEFVDYKGANATNRSDLAFNYKHKKGSVDYFSTNNKQSITLDSTSIDHRIISNTLIFNQQFAKRFRVLGGIDFYLIDQEEGISRNYNANHEFLELRYAASKSFQLYGKFEHRFFRNHLQENTMIVFRPGIRYNKGIFFSHLAVRISPQQAFPIAQIIIKPKPFYFEAFLKVRNPIFILKRKGYLYTGLQTGVHFNNNKHKINADVEVNYNLTSNIVAPIPTANFFTIKADGEYRYKFQNIDTYLAATYARTGNKQYFYHPEISTLRAGLQFHTKFSKNKVLLDVDLNANYILHDDPNNVSFDPSTLTYNLITDAAIVGDWKINLNINTRINSFILGLDISTPINPSQDLYWHLYEGIYTSSDFLIGNTFYAGLNINWLW